MSTQHGGLLVLGTAAQCGKTVVTAGLAAVLAKAGFGVQAVKPLSFQVSAMGLEQGDQAYLTQVTEQLTTWETVQAPSAWEITVPVWNRMMEQCKLLPYTCVMEGVGHVGTPWQIHQGHMMDGVDVASTLGLSLVIVGRAGASFLEDMRVALHFLEQRSVRALGFIRVVTDPKWGEATQEHEATLLTQTYQVPFLGSVPHSPSIDVRTLQQGNLVRVLEENIDLLPLQMQMPMPN